MHHMYAVGLDVDTNALVSTEKNILLYAGNLLYCSPLVPVTFGKICNSWQSAGNFRFMPKAMINPTAPPPESLMLSICGRGEGRP